MTVQKHLSSIPFVMPGGMTTPEAQIFLEKLVNEVQALRTDLEGLPTSGSGGSDGLGWTGGSYSASTGIVTFTSDDGLGFATGDLRGAAGATGSQGPQGEVGPQGPAGSGGGTYSLLKAKGNTGGVSFDDTENAIVWATPAINTASDVSVSGSVITINNTGAYKFTVALRTDNGNRTELFIRTYINAGGGLTQDTDETVSDYVSRDGDQDTGTVVLVTALSLSATNTVEFRGFGDTDGSSIALDAGTRLLVERVA